MGEGHGDEDVERPRPPAQTNTEPQSRCLAPVTGARRLTGANDRGDDRLELERQQRHRLGEPRQEGRAVTGRERDDGEAVADGVVVVLAQAVAGPHQHLDVGVREALEHGRRIRHRADERVVVGAQQEARGHEVGAGAVGAVGVPPAHRPSWIS